MLNGSDQEGLRRQEFGTDLLQDALYRIVQAAERADSLEDLLPRLHAIINEVMPAANFYIALYDEESNTVTFPYFVDEVDVPPEGGRQPLGRGLTEYVLRTGKSLLCDQTLHERMEREGKIELVGVPSPIWLGVPLILEGRVIGVMAVQHYRDPRAYGEREKRILEFVSGQVASAIGRRQKDDAIRDSEVRYRRLFEESPISLWEEDFSQVRVYLDALRLQGVEDLRAYLDNHPEALQKCLSLVRVLDVNQTTLRMYGATGKAEFIQNLSTIIPPESLPVFRDEILAFFEGRGWFEARLKNLTLRGEVLDIILRCSVSPGSEQSLSRVIVSIVDITALTTIEKALRESEENYRSLFVNVPDGVYRTTPDGRILDANPALVRMLGFDSLEELLQESVQGLYAMPAERARFIAHVQTEGEARNLQLVLRRKDGREVICLDNSRAVYGPDGQILYYEGTLTDITELKMAERRLQEKVVTLEILAELDRQTLKATDVDTVMRLVCDNAAALLHAPKAAVISRGAGGSLRLNATYGLAHPDSILEELPTLFGEEWLPAGSVISVSRFGEEDARLRRFRTGEDIHAMLGASFDLEGGHGGLVMVFDTKARAWTEDEAGLLQLLTGQVAIALERARLFSETRQRAEELRRRNLELDRLYRVSGSLISGISFDLHALANTIVQIVCAEFLDAVCSLFLLDESAGLLRRAAWAGPVVPHFASDVLPLDGPGLVVRAAKTGRPILVNDVASEPDYFPGWKDSRSEMTVPLIVKDRVIGALDVQRAHLHAFNEQDQRLLTVFAARAALLIENARLYLQTDMRLQRLSALRAVDQAIASSQDLRITLSLLLEQTTSLLSVDAATVWLFDPALQMLQYAAGRGFVGPPVERALLRLGEGLAGRAAMDRVMTVAQDLSGLAGASFYTDRLAQEHLVSGVAVPLIAKGALKGVLEMYYRRPFEPDPEWADFLETLARQVAIAIEDAELFEGLQRSNLELAVAYDAMIESWARALELCGKEPPGHSQRVIDLALDLARRLGVEDAELTHIYRGALLHDIGLLVVSDRVLGKVSPLNEKDWREIRKHPQYAYDLLYQILHLHPAISIPYAHHERWDGGGYPRGLSGPAIPLPARLFAVVDTWDAMQVARRYRPAASREQAVAHLRAEAGKKFDPRVVTEFLRMMGED